MSKIQEELKNSKLKYNNILIKAREKLFFDQNFSLKDANLSIFCKNIHFDN